MHVSKNNHGWWTVRFACRFDLLRFIVIISTVLCICVAHSGHGRSQWETTLQCNSVSHWLSLSPRMIPVTYIFLMLLRCHWCNSMIVPVSVHWSWKIWIRPLLYIYSKTQAENNVHGFSATSVMTINSLAPGRSGCDYKKAIFNRPILFSWLISSCRLMIMTWHECHTTLLMINQST